MIEMTTPNGLPLASIGIEILKIVSNSNTTMPVKMLNIPGSMSTIFLPDQYMMDNADIQSFMLHGKKSKTGTISFQSQHEHDIAVIAISQQHNRLWLKENAVLVPPKPIIHTMYLGHNVCQPIEPDAPSTTTAKLSTYSTKDKPS